MSTKRTASSASNSPAILNIPFLKYFTPMVLRWIFIFIALGWMALMASTWSEAATSSGDEEYNFSWLDPDKKIYVLHIQHLKNIKVICKIIYYLHMKY